LQPRSAGCSSARRGRPNAARVAAQRIRGDGDEKGCAVDTKLLSEDNFAYCSAFAAGVSTDTFN
jgi:hypothetical protein